MKRIVLGLSAVALLAAAAPASAQQWDGDDHGARWNHHDRHDFAGYPEFAEAKDHIRSEVREGLDDGWLDEDLAQDAIGELQQIQFREGQEYRAYGWRLPEYDRDQFRASLDELDRSIGQARDDQ